MPAIFPASRRAAAWVRRHPLGLVALVAALGLASAPACSSNSGPKYPNLVSFCNGQASAECNQQVLAACGLPSQATCVTQRQAICVAAAPQGTTYNPSAAEGCVNQVSSAYADAQLTLNESNAISSACAGVFDGPGDKDAACKTDQDCKLSTGLKCVLTAGSTRGTCQMPRMVGGGGSCAAPDAQCAPDFHCGSTAHCDQDAAVNESCSDANPCGPGLTCSSMGTCMAKAADGTMCAANAECLNGICNKGSTAMFGVCVSQVSLAANEPFCVESR